MTSLYWIEILIIKKIYKNIKFCQVESSPIALLHISFGGLKGFTDIEWNHVIRINTQQQLQDIF